MLYSHAHTFKFNERYHFSLCAAVVVVAFLSFAFAYTTLYIHFNSFPLKMTEKCHSTKKLSIRFERKALPWLSHFEGIIKIEGRCILYIRSWNEKQTLTNERKNVMKRKTWASKLCTAFMWIDYMSEWVWVCRYISFMVFFFFHKKRCMWMLVHSASDRRRRSKI